LRAAGFLRAAAIFAVLRAGALRAVTVFFFAVAMRPPLLPRANHPRQERITADSSGQFLTSGKSDYRTPAAYVMLRPMTEKCRLRLHRVHLGLFDDIEVFDIDRRVALPFDWISTDDGEPMLEVDACYERVAAIRIVPLKHRRRKPGEPIDDL